MKVFTGKVKSTKMQKTAVVVVERIVQHPVYKKRMKKFKKYLVHDEFGTKVGQLVKFVASRPYSKLKKWKVIEIVEDKKSETKSKTKNKIKTKTKINKKKGVKK